jgi:hypothetical protein
LGWCFALKAIWKERWWYIKRLWKFENDWCQIPWMWQSRTTNIGLVLKSQGDLKGALAEYQKALEIQERLTPDSLAVMEF